jgi:hypothetical protein
MTNNHTFDKFDKYLEKVDLIDYYITKNINKLVENRESYEFITENPFLLGVVNKSNKNSLIILLENKKYDIVMDLIKDNNNLLEIKNYNENTLFNILLQYNNFYDLIIDVIKSYDFSLVMKLLINKNKDGDSFINLLIKLMNNCSECKNKLSEYDKVIVMFKSIINLDKEKELLLITTLCKKISNKDVIHDILEKIITKKTVVYSDENLLNGVDYLLLKNNIVSLNFLMTNVYRVKFCSFENLFVFEYIEDNSLDKMTTNIILRLLEKSNIYKIKNKNGENILQLLAKHNRINKKILNKYNKLFGINKIIKYKKNTGNKFSLKSILVQADLSNFSSDPLNNMLYTLYILQKYKNITIPYKIKSKNEKNTNDLVMNMSNMDYTIMTYLKTYNINYNYFLTHLIVWKNKNNYYIDDYLLEFIKQNKNNKRFILIKLSIILLKNTNSRHANYLIVDTKQKIVERFEPYGEIEIENSFELNKIIEKNICNKINYKFLFSQLYPGFQIKSDETNYLNRNIGDPAGYCLAWCYVYLETKLMFENEPTTDTRKIIETYVNNNLKKDFGSVNDKINKYIYFIRYYSKHLEDEKNKLLKKYGITNFYKNTMTQEETTKIIIGINKNLIKIVE